MIGNCWSPPTCTWVLTLETYRMMKQADYARIQMIAHLVLSTFTEWTVMWYDTHTVILSLKCIIAQMKSTQIKWLVIGVLASNCASRASIWSSRPWLLTVARASMGQVFCSREEISHRCAVIPCGSVHVSQFSASHQCTSVKQIVSIFTANSIVTANTISMKNGTIYKHIVGCYIRLCG